MKILKIFSSKYETCAGFIRQKAGIRCQVPSFALIQSFLTKSSYESSIAFKKLLVMLGEEPGCYCKYITVCLLQLLKFVFIIKQNSHSLLCANAT
jgi:hypothetical protein